MHAAITSPSSVEILCLKRDLAEASLRAATLYVDVLRAEHPQSHDRSRCRPCDATATAERVVEFRTVQLRTLSERVALAE